ncbi:MAG TPA: DUF6498-containing protein [Rudaea sp.]|nr:DUF6498-containing protein [Rudaea sp.]
MNTAAAEPSAWSGLVKLAQAFAANPKNWGVLARNLIPVAGVYVFGWFAPMTAFNYWFDGVSALAAILASASAHTVVEMRDRVKIKRSSLIAIAVVWWAVLFGMLGIPYWIMIANLPQVAPLPLALAEIARSPVLALAFGSIAFSHFWNAFHGSYAGLPEKRLQTKVQADLHMLVVRAAVMVVVASVGMGFLLVPILALFVTAVDTWPDVLAEVKRRNRDAMPAAAGVHERAR